MNFRVYDSARGKVFGTLAEASAYANEICRKTRLVLAVTETRAKVTHIYDLSKEG